MCFADQYTSTIATVCICVSVDRKEKKRETNEVFSPISSNDLFGGIPSHAKKATTGVHDWAIRFCGI